YQDRLYVGGYAPPPKPFGGSHAVFARWDGASWETLPTPPCAAGCENSSIDCFAVYDGSLVAGGEFSPPVARWDGAGWQPMGTSLSGGVTALTMSNGRLTAGGTFSIAGTNGLGGLAAWNGSDWEGLGEGVSVQGVHCLAVQRGDLFVGGSFIWAGSVVCNS